MDEGGEGSLLSECNAACCVPVLVANNLPTISYTSGWGGSSLYSSSSSLDFFSLSFFLSLSALIQWRVLYPAAETLSER